MRTFFYYLDTGEWGPFRNGPYMVDGKPGVLPDNIVEIEYVENPYPVFDASSQISERTDYLDLSQKKIFYQLYCQRFNTRRN